MNQSEAKAYHFITHWHVSATPEEVYRTLEDINTLTHWWPSVYLDVKELEKGQPGGVGRVVEIYNLHQRLATLHVTLEI